MPAYASHVQRMTAGSGSERGAGLDGLSIIVSDAGLPVESRLAILREPGLLAALNSFLVGDRTVTALKVLLCIVRRTNMSFSAGQCLSVIFVSPCFPSLMAIAATGSTMQLKYWAYHVAISISMLEDERKKDFLDSPGMVTLLLSGLKHANNDVAGNATITIHNLCVDEITASAVLDSHPKLVQALVDSFSTSGVCEKFKCK
jgi:hypothetical protein